MLLRSSIAGFAALLISLGALSSASAAAKTKATSAPDTKATSAPEAEPQDAPPAAPEPEAVVPQESAVSDDPEAAMAPQQELKKPSNAPQFGAALRARYVTLPRWFLGMFTKASRALHSYGVGLEGIRRKRSDKDPNRYTEMSLALGFQSMSPPDGNWLGKGKDPAIDTDWVQFKDFGFWTIDFTYLGRQFFNQVIGIHYGAGLGLAIVQGDVLRTSSQGCTDDNLDECRPQCNGHDCSEAELKASEGEKDTYDDPHRFREGSIPAVIPLINLVAGVDFRIPTVPGLEFRVEGGFYNAFFVGGSVAYMH